MPRFWHEEARVAGCRSPPKYRLLNEPTRVRRRSDGKMTAKSSHTRDAGTVLWTGGPAAPRGVSK